VRSEDRTVKVVSQGSYEVTSARPVGARQQPEHQADRSSTRHKARHTQSQTQARTADPNIMAVTPPDHTGHMTEQLDLVPQLRLVSTSRMPHRLTRATRQEGLRGVARARVALAATAPPPEINLDAA